MVPSIVTTDFSFLVRTKCQTSCLTNSLGWPTRPRNTRWREVPHEGGSDPTELLGGSSAKKWGRSRPICCILHGDFRRGSGCKSLTINSVGRAPGEESGEEEAEVCNSCCLHITHHLQSRVSHRILRGTRARQRNFVQGWSDPKHHFGHGTVCKSGVAPAQHGVLPASKVSILSRATSSPWGTCSIATVNARVTDRVICVFHAPVTFSLCRR